MEFITFLQNTMTTQTMFSVDYDLSAYDGKLEDGTLFNAPGPLTVRNDSFDLKDKETDLVIGGNSNCIKWG